MTFIKLFEMTTIGASDEDRAIALLTQLDSDSVDLVMLSLGETWKYKDVKGIIICEFSEPESMATRKTEFLQISFQKNETIQEFSDQFYQEAQVLTGAGRLDAYDAKIAMAAAVKPFKDLQIAMMSATGLNMSMSEMVEYIRRCGLHSEPLIKGTPAAIKIGTTDIVKVKFRLAVIA